MSSYGTDIVTNGARLYYDAHLYNNAASFGVEIFGESNSYSQHKIYH